MATQPRPCPDCHATTQEIKLIDKSHFGDHTDLEYASSEATRSLWTGRFPVEGRVVALMCSECGRIGLYGAAKSTR
jgi:hypothetical protein